MHTNGNNGKGQERVVSVRLLEEYCEWLNSSLGESFLRVTTGQTSNGKYTLTITSSLGIGSSGNPYVVAEGETGLGTVYWDRTTTDSSTVSTSGNGSVTISAGTQLVTSGMYPKGKFHLEYNGKKYLELNNTNTTSYTGYDEMFVTGATDMTKCVTYHDITASTYVRYFNEQMMLDGLIVTGYSVGDGKLRYNDNQLVVQKDIEFGKFQYNLAVSAITIEVDAMNDLEEYRYGVIPGSSNLPYAVVYDVTNGTSTPFKDFDLTVELTDNPAFNSGKTYSNVNITKGSSIATAMKVMSGSEEVYKVDVYYYADSGYTLTSGQVVTRVGTAITNVFFPVSTHSFTGTDRNVYVTIASNGEVKFAIKQRKEIYGYFPVDVYRQGTSDYSVDENGNVALSAADKFVKANVSTVSNAFTGTSYNVISTNTTGWVDNAGDNFGTGALSNGKKYLTQSEKSVYDPVLLEQGVTDMTLCGKDVYNTNNIVYDRGIEVGNSVYHVAYANDAYGNNNYEGGFLGTRHLFCSGGTMKPSYTKPDCTSYYMDYTYDPFTSDYTYDMNYERVYYKDLHSYGIVSILRRFRNINGVYVDTFKSDYSENRMAQDPNASCVPTSETISGDNFPKHILGKTYKLTLTQNWHSVNTIRSGSHSVSGWTTVFEYVDKRERLAYETKDLTFSGEPTVRDIDMVYKQHYNYYDYFLVCESVNSAETTFYNAIHPMFYMVDAETCDGYSSGYTFSIPKTITDRAHGIDEVRNYYMDDNHYFLLENVSNNQACKKDMITYVSYSGDTPVFNSARYGNTEKDGVVRASCCPSAPLQRVYWVDSYAPNSSYGNAIFPANTKPIAFIDENKKYIGSGSPELYGYDLLPGRNDYDYTLHDITVDEINNFTTYSFAGDTVYGENGGNYSSHNLLSSITYTTKNNMSYVANIDDYLGYEIDTSRYPYTGPMAAVNSLDDFIESNGSYEYTGNSYVYFNQTGLTRTTYSDTDCRFLPVEIKNDYYSDGNALRPCQGDVTIPYWYTTLEFMVRLNEEPQNASSYDPISDFGIEVSVSVNNSHYTKLTTGGIDYPATGDEKVHYQLIDDENYGLSIATHDYESLKGIYGYLTKKGVLISGNDTYLQRMELTLLFIDAYPKNVSYFNVNISCTKQGMTNQVLRWELNGRTGQKVGADTFYQMSGNQWGNYEANNKTSELSCIGTTTNNNSIRQMMRIFRDNDEVFFDVMVDETNKYSKEAVDGGNKGTWY